MVMGADGKELKFTDLEIATEEEVAEMLRRKPMPNRTMVAISEDRQWLVVLNPAGYSGWFVRYRLNAYGYWVPDVQAGEPCCIKDTGQDAQEVLDEFLGDKRT